MVQMLRPHTSNNTSSQGIGQLAEKCIDGKKGKEGSQVFQGF